MRWKTAVVARQRLWMPFTTDLTWQGFCTFFRVTRKMLTDTAYQITIFITSTKNQGYHKHKVLTILGAIYNKNLGTILTNFKILIIYNCLINAHCSVNKNLQKHMNWLKSLWETNLYSHSSIDSVVTIVYKWKTTRFRPGILGFYLSLVRVRYVVARPYL